VRYTQKGINPKEQNRINNVQHRWKYIVGLLLVVWGVLHTALDSSEAFFAEQESGVAIESAVGFLSPQHEDLGRLIMQSLNGDRLPSTYAQQTGRLLLPVIRWNPYLRGTYGESVRMVELVCLRQNHVQRKSEARVRAAQDESGYYVFALRKIII